MLEMYKGVANSPETTITNNINESDTLIYVLDETRIPEPPNLMVLGTGVSAETIKVISIDGNALTVERGFQGVPRSWNAGTVIARNFTEYDYNALKENIETLKENVDTNADDIVDLQDDLAAHKAEITQQTLVVARDVSLTGIQSITTTANRKIKSIRILGTIAATNKTCDGVWSESGGARSRYYLPTTMIHSVSSYPLAFSDNTETDRTLGMIQNVTLGSFDINWIKIGNGATGSAEIIFLVTYHD